MMKHVWMKNLLNTALRSKFLRREDGSVALEATIVMPLLFWTYLSMFSIFDAFQMYNTHQKAAYTVGDIISRETAALDDEYLTGTHALFEYLSRSEGQTTLRVSSIYYDEENDTYNTEWSQTRGGSIAPLTSEDTANWHDKIPVMVDGEFIIITETWSNYNPPFNTGLENRQIDNMVFTSPRYAPCVLWFDASEDGCVPSS